MYYTCTPSLGAFDNIVIKSANCRLGCFRGSYDGKLLRIDVDNRDPGREYAIPPDNPFVGNPATLPEIYAYGLGQPWRCSVDSGDRDTGAGAGRVFCGDVASYEIAEEVNIMEKGGNYGYPVFEGDVCLVDNNTCNEGKLI